MGDVITPLDYARVEDALGKQGARLWAQKNGISIAEGAASGLTLQSTPASPVSPTGALGGETKVDEEEDGNEDVLPVGGLNYADAQREAAAANQSLYGQIQSNISVLDAAREALRNRRFAPSNSEKWLAIAAALGQPTRTGSFGESLGNLAQALGAQKAERRKAEQEAEMLGLKYGLEAGTERMRLAQARATEADRTLRAVVAANKKTKGAQPKTTTGPDFKTRTRYGTEVKEPPTAAIFQLQDYLSSPDASDADKQIARRNFDSKFGYGAAELFGGEE